MFCDPYVSMVPGVVAIAIDLWRAGSLGALAIIRRQEYSNVQVSALVFGTRKDRCKEIVVVLQDGYLLQVRVQKTDCCASQAKRRQASRYRASDELKSNRPSSTST